MWITTGEGKRLNVRRVDFEALQNAIKKENPKDIAKYTLKMVANIKMAMRYLTKKCFEGLDELEGK